MHHSSRSAVARLLENTYLEVMPFGNVEQQLEQLPRESYVAVTCSEKHGIDRMLAVTERLASRPLRLVPHLAARMVRDRRHLRTIVRRLRNAGVASAFIPGGDAATVAGTYPDSLRLLRDLAELDHGLEDIGIAAFPEVHPILGAEDALTWLLTKQAYATYLVTQMCFDGDAIVEWLGMVRKAGVTLPTWIGLPGVADRARLMRLSLHIGVGRSIRLLRRQTGLTRALASPHYEPGALLEQLAPRVADRRLDVPGFHLFSFNSIALTESWRRAALEQCRVGAGGWH